MPRKPTLRYHRGTLVLHPPPKGKAWLDVATWDDRIEKFRVPAPAYRQLLEATRAEGAEVVDEARAYQALTLEPALSMTPYPHQREALAAWIARGRRGVVVLPTGAGKTYLAQLAIEATPRSTLVVVPTLDLMQQWYAHLGAAFPDHEIGLLGGGSHDETPLLIATYDSAAIFAEQLGNRYGLLVFDECHHLPGEFRRAAAELSLAPYRLGLTATPDHDDERRRQLDRLIGPIVYHRRPAELTGSALADYDLRRLRVRLSQRERARYDELIAQRNAFLRRAGIHLGSLSGWQAFVRASARSRDGRAAMLAHREARRIAFGTDAKLRVLAELLARHHDDRLLVFTADNQTVYRVAHAFLIPAITHQTPVKERHELLTAFRDGRYPRLVASRVLNEGIDVPEASVAVVLSGSGSSREHVQRLGRILRRREGKRAVLYEVIAEETSEEGVSARRRREPANGLPERSRKPRLALEPIAADDALAFDDLGFDEPNPKPPDPDEDG